MSDLNPLTILQGMLQNGASTQQPPAPQFPVQNLANPAALRAQPNANLQIGNVSFQGAQPVGQMGVQDNQEQDQYKTLQSQQDLQAQQQKLAISEALKNADLSEGQRQLLKTYQNHMTDLVGLAGDTAKDQMYTQMSKNQVARHADHLENVAMANETARQLEETARQAEGSEPGAVHTGIPLGLGKQLRDQYKAMTGTDAPEDDKQFRDLMQFGAGQANSAAGNPTVLRQEAQKMREINATGVEAAKVQASASRETAAGAQTGESARQASKLALEPSAVAQERQTRFNNGGAAALTTQELASMVGDYSQQALATAEKNKSLEFAKLSSDDYTPKQKNAIRQSIIDNYTYGNPAYDRTLKAYQDRVEAEKNGPAPTAAPTSTSKTPNADLVKGAVDLGSDPSKIDQTKIDKSNPDKLYQVGKGTYTFDPKTGSLKKVDVRIK